MTRPQRGPAVPAGKAGVGHQLAGSVFILFATAVTACFSIAGSERRQGPAAPPVSPPPNVL